MKQVFIFLYCGGGFFCSNSFFTSSGEVWRAIKCWISTSSWIIRSNPFSKLAGYQLSSHNSVVLLQVLSRDSVATEVQVGIQEQDLSANLQQVLHPILQQSELVFFVLGTSTFAVSMGATFFLSYSCSGG